VKRAGAVFLVILGIASILFGLLFVLGAAGRTHRYVVAAVALALGGVFTGLGIRFFKQADRASPEQIRAEILALAREQNGEISEAEIQAVLGRRFSGAADVLSEMRAANLCQIQKRKTEIYYVFPEMQPRLTIRRCEFCSSELPLDEDLDSCPNCGGSIKTQMERLSVSKDDAYNMDE
jgi:hypothetical protein